MQTNQNALSSDNMVHNGISIERLNHALSEYESGRLLAPMRAAKLLGLRQYNQLTTSLQKNKRILFPLMVSTLSPKELERQIQVGEQFICGYRPGVIADETLFDELAFRTNISLPVLKLAKSVLVSGIPLEDLDIHGSGVTSRQSVDQACVTFCRMMVGIESYRTQAFKQALAHVSKHATRVEPFTVLSTLSGDSIKRLKEYESGAEVPTFSQAAFFSLISASSDAIVRWIDGVLDQVFTKAWTLQYRFNLWPKQFVDMLAGQFSSVNTAYMFTLSPKESVVPYDVKELLKLNQVLEDLLAIKHPIVYAAGTSPFGVDTTVYDMLAVEQKLANRKTLKDVGEQISKKIGCHVTAINSVYKRWKARGVPAQFWKRTSSEVGGYSVD